MLSWFRRTSTSQAASDSMIALPGSEVSHRVGSFNLKPSALCTRATIGLCGA